jgi:hypothetical protein
VVRIPVVIQAPVVRSSTPVVVAPVQHAKAKRKAAPVKVAPAVKRKAPAPTPAARTPHDRHAVPLAAFVPSVDSIDRDLLALAGFGLLFVAVGGGVVVVFARKQLEFVR